MLFKIVTLLMILVTWIDGLEPEKLSTLPTLIQGPKRVDSPVFDEYTTVDDLTTEQMILKSHVPMLKRPPLIQYAPLKPTTKELPKVNEDDLEITEKKRSKDHLEPRVDNLENSEAHNNQYRSFVPGHNVEVLPVSQNNALMTAMYENLHEYLQKQKVNVPVYNTHDPSKRIPFEPRDFNVEDNQTPIPIKNTNQMHNVLYPAHSLTPHVAHKEEYLAPRPKVPRLHLNIARVYGIAHLPHKASEPKKFHKTKLDKDIKTFTRTRAILKPQKKSTIHEKTILFPVDNLRKFFRIK